MRRFGSRGVREAIHVGGVVQSGQGRAQVSAGVAFTV